MNSLPLRESVPSTGKRKAERKVAYGCEYPPLDLVPHRFRLGPSDENVRDSEGLGQLAPGGHRPRDQPGRSLPRRGGEHGPLGGRASPEHGNDDEQAQSSDHANGNDACYAGTFGESTRGLTGSTGVHSLHRSN